MFKKMFYGNPNKKDYDITDLPATRVELLGDLFRTRKITLIKLSLLVTIFALPMIGYIIYMNMLIGSLGTTPTLADFNNISEISSETIILMQEVYALKFTLYLGLIPCFMILSIGLSGAFSVARQLAWSEGFILLLQFGEGIKNNIKQYLLTFFILGLSFFIMMVNIIYFSYIASISPLTDLLSIVLGIVQFIIVCLFTIFMMTQAINYNLSNIALVKNSFMLLFAMLPKNVLILILGLLPLIIGYLMPLLILQLIFYILYALIGIAFTLMLYTLYAHYVFDKYINIKVNPSIVGRGLWKRESDDGSAIEVVDKDK